MSNDGPSLSRERSALFAVLALGATMALPPEALHAQERVIAANSPVRTGDSQDSDLLSTPANLNVRDVSLETAFDALESSSGVSVAYSPTVLPDSHRATCICEDVTVDEAMSTLLGGTGLEIFVAADQVVIRRQRGHLSPWRLLPARSGPNGLAVSLQRLIGQPASRYSERVFGTLSGQVIELGTGRPLVAARVQITGTNLGTLTDDEGRFEIPGVPAGDVQVQVQLLGYVTASQSVNIPADGTVTLNFELEPGPLAMDEIVVVGYGSQAREMVTGSVSQLSSEQLERTTATTTGEALMGKMAGILTRRGYQGRNDASLATGRDGRPGAPANIQIRNLGDPLYVIDGVPREAADFNALNIADIENISVLKDAAASVYGFRAANGVILITTKSGSAFEQAPRLRLDGYYGWQNISRTNYPFGYGVTAYQQIYSVLEHEQNTGLTRSRSPEEMEQWRQAPTYETWDHVINNPNAMQANLSASLSGGTGNASYYLSLGHVNQDYVMKDNNYNRSNVQANLRAELFDRFEIGTELSGRVQNHENIAGTAHADPVINLFRAVQSPHSHQAFYANNDPDFIAGDVRILARTPPAMRRDITGYQDQILRNVTGNFWAEYTLPFGTTLRGTLSQRYDDWNFEFQTKTFNGFCYNEATDTHEICASIDGANRRAFREQTSGTFGQLMVSHSGQFGGHSLSGTVAYEFDGSETNRHDISSTPPLNTSDLISQTDLTNYENIWGIQRRASFAARVNYAYEQKYILEVLGRYDGSYLYAPSKRWGLFPGVSLGWRMTEESFMQDRFPFLNELKPRISWGQTGLEQGILPWGFLGGATYGVDGGAVLDGQAVTAVRPRGLPITNLSWVTSTTRNIGFDFEMFDGRFSGEVDLFERKLTGLPASREDVVLPVEVGYELPDENLESEANRGLEMVVRYTGQIGNLSYTLAPNFTVGRRRILDRYLPRYGNSWDRYRNGQEDRWQGVAFGYQVIGQFQSVEEIANHPVDLDGRGNATLLPGDWIYKDVNDDGVINELDHRPIGWPGSGGFGEPGNVAPILQYGLSGTFGYGAFTLSWDVYGGTMFSHNTDLDRRIPYNADHGGAAYWNSRWRRADVFDDNSEWIPGRYPPLRRGDQNHSSYRTNDFTLTNVSYLRLNRVELAYDVPADLTTKLGLSRSRVYASATNPWVRQFYGQNWAQDPEAGGNQIYPPSSVVSIGFTTTLGGSPQPVVAGGPADGRE